MNNGNKKNKLGFFLLLALDLAFLAISIYFITRPSLNFGNIALLNQKGVIAEKERSLIITAVLLMLIVVIPVFTSLFYFAWKYRASNTESNYSPNWDGSLKLKLLWWAIPAAIIFVLSIINWKSTHVLDPYKPIASDKKPITIQVVALQWKWLFIYPEKNIATVNYIQFPEKTPINFELTADAPMNSFWIPELGGQMYAMAGMSTQLHLMASTLGEFNGAAAEINGKGFAGMKFVAKATSQTDFDQWVRSVRQGANVLDSEKDLDISEYNRLSQPSENNSVTFYASTSNDLYNNIIMKFMAPASSATSTPSMQGMDMHSEGTQ